MISVIIPIYNSENTIITALGSVKNQTFGKEHFEIFVINDGSTDLSKNRVQEFISNNPKLNIILINQANKGVSAARNAGLRICKGEYIAFLDADDEWYPEKIEKQINCFNANLQIDFLATLRNDDKVQFPYKNNILVEITFRKLLIKTFGQTSTAMIKRKVLKNTGFFDENQRFSEDANYWLRISANNMMYLLNENLVETGGGKRSFGVSGLSANLQQMEIGIQKNLRELLNTKRIYYFEYILYYIFTKLKFVLRLIKNRL